MVSEELKTPPVTFTTVPPVEGPDFGATEVTEGDAEVVKENVGPEAEYS
jgi:hypothetical protein